MPDLNLALFQHIVDSVERDGGRELSHGFQGLAHRGQWRGIQVRSRDAVESDYRTIFGDVEAGLVQSTDDAKGRQIVKRHDRGEGDFPPQKLFGEFKASMEAGKRI